MTRAFKLSARQHAPPGLFFWLESHVPVMFPTASHAAS